MKIRALFLCILMALCFSFDGLQAAETPKIGVVLSIGGLRDSSFNDAAYDGIMSLRKDDHCSVEVVEPANIGGIEEGLEYLCTKKLDLVCAVGLFANDAIRRVAAKFPDQKFVLLDSVVTSPNVLSILFDEEEGSFYAGAFAAIAAKGDVVGFLGGMDSPVIGSFERGFKRGAAFVNPEIKVVSRYVGDTPEAFHQPDKAFEIGLNMNRQGAEIIYHASGKSGLGLIEASRRGNFLVIGVDSDQSRIAPGKVPASMVKRLDNGLVKAVNLLQDGNFTGGIWTLGLKDQGIELSLSRFNRELLTPELKQKLSEVENFILKKH
jgi:basic membrane protein A